MRSEESRGNSGRKKQGEGSLNGRENRGDGTMGGDGKKWRR